jgi:hypothetical protein
MPARHVQRWDLGDIKTGGYLDRVSDEYLPNDVQFDCRPRPTSLQDVWNRNLTDPSLADFWLPMPDGGFCASPD